MQQLKARILFYLSEAQKKSLEKNEWDETFYMELSWRDSLQVHRNGADFSSQTFAPEKLRNLRLNQGKLGRPTDSLNKYPSFLPSSHFDIYLNLFHIKFYRVLIFSILE